MKNFIFILVLLITGLTSNSLTAQGSWGLQTNPTSAAGESMQFISATEGWISLSSNQLLHTQNAGATWNIVTPNATDITMGLDAPGTRISFINSSTGWVIKTFMDSNENAIGAVLYKTTTSGSTWERTVLSTTSGDGGIQVQFVDENNGWVLIYNMNTSTPTFLKTTNGGASWQVTNGGGIFYYVNETVGYSFSAGVNIAPPFTFYKTVDGGATWSPQYTDNTAGDINAILFTDPSNGWIVGRNGKIFKTTNGGTNWIPITNTGFTTNYNNSALSFINPTTGWIATKTDNDGNPFMLKTTDGGATWTTQSLPFSYKVYSISFWDESNGWATSDYGPIAKYSVYNGVYSNATLVGPWFGYNNEPLSPYDDQFGYLVFDGSGNIIDGSQFPGPAHGTYTVSSNGIFAINLIVGEEVNNINGQLNSPTSAAANVTGQSLRMHKVSNPAALKDQISGMLTTSGVCGQRTVSFDIDSNGNIISSTGFTAAVTGRIYTDLGVFIGHIKTAETTSGWNEFNIKGYYDSISNKLTGTIEFDGNSCSPGSEVNLFRIDNLGLNDNLLNKYISIYPNPNGGSFYFSLKNTTSKIKAEIYSITGQKVYESSNFEMQAQNEINFAPQSKGMYFIKIYDGDQTYSEKIMIQ